MVIKTLKRVGLAWDVVTITPERQAQKLIGAEKPAKKTAASEEKVPEPVA
jgi:stearoyl-CoA desaturase (delta-9 desaturase)